MKKNGAIWVALVVVAVAALLMYFVVLPQLRDSKAIDELAKKASDTVEQAKDTAQKTISETKDTAQKAADKAADTVKDAAADPKTGVLAKMARIKADGETASVEFEALFADNNQPTVEQVQAARDKLIAALKGASEVTAPEGLDATTSGLIAKTAEGAKRALDLLNAMPSDVAGAKKAYDGIKVTMLAALDGKEVDKTADQNAAKAADAKPADDVAKLEPSQSTDAKPADATESKPEVTADASLPTFDVLRVEKDGSTVIAGKAAPNSKIDILDGDKVIASTDAGESGDFVAVLDNPLPAGDHQILLQATGKDGKKAVSVEVATVSVPADKSGELLAMVTKPGEPSRIMEMPEAKKDTVVAQNNAGDQATKDVAVKADTPSSETKKETPAAETAAKTETKPVDVAKTDVKPVLTPELPDASADLANNAPLVKQDAAKTETAADATKPADTAEVAKNETATDTAKTATDTAKPAAKTTPEVLVSAVEIEGSKIFVAGAAKPKSIVRVYADDKLVAEVSTDENGRFVADSTLPLAVGDHTIRADVLSADGKKVAFRASVPFFRPEGEQLAAVAGDTTTADQAKMQPLADGNYDKAREEAGKAVSLLKGLYDAGRTPTLDELAAARSATEIALKTLSQIKVDDANDPVAKEMADKTADKAAEALALLKSLPQDAGAVKTALNSIDDAVTSAVAPSMDTAAANKTTTATGKEQAADATVAKQPAKSENNQIADNSAKSSTAKDTADATKAAQATPVDKAASDQSQKSETKPATQVASTDDSQPKVIEQAPLKPSQTSVIIRRGDTLWQISRRVYGRGVRYTTIYVANEDQINDPDRIMPGQIFGVPDKYLPNSEELHRERMDHKKH